MAYRVAIFIAVELIAVIAVAIAQSILTSAAHNYMWKFSSLSGSQEFVQDALIGAERGFSMKENWVTTRDSKIALYLTPAALAIVGVALLRTSRHKAFFVFVVPVAVAQLFSPFLALIMRERLFGYPYTSGLLLMNTTTSWLDGSVANALLYPVALAIAAGFLVSPLIVYTATWAFIVALTLLTIFDARNGRTQRHQLNFITE